MERFVGGKHLLSVAVLCLTLGMHPAPASKIDAEKEAGDSGDVPLNVVLSPGPDFKLDVLPILARNCVKCHGPERTENGLRLDSYDGVMKGTAHGKIIEPGMASQSVLTYVLENPASMRLKMPHDTMQKLSPNRRKNIYYWIEDGAQNN